MPLKKRFTSQAPVESGVGLKNLVPGAIRGPVDKVGDWLGVGTRIGASVLGAEGGIPGAAINAGGEALAQFLEGSLDTKTTGTRVGVEAGLGAIPFGGLLSKGRALRAAGKTALVAGGGDVGRQWGEGNFDTPEPTPANPSPKAPGWNMGRTGLATLLGGVGGAAANRMQMPKTPSPEEVIIESSGAVPRSIASVGLPMGNTPKNDAAKKINMTGDRASIPSGGRTQSAARALPTTANYGGGVSEIRGITPVASHATTLSGPRTLAGRVAYGGAIDDRTDLITDLQSQFSRAMDTSDTRFEALAKKAKADAARALIQRRRIAAGVEPETTFTSSIKSETPTGVVESMTTKFRQPKVDEDAVAASGVVEDSARTFAKGNDVVPEMVDEAQKVVKGVNAKTAERLKNLDAKGLGYFNHLRNFEGENDGTAYKLAVREMAERKAKITRPLPSAAPAVDELKSLMSPTSKEVMEQSVHPSFLDEGFEGLENAAIKPKPVTPPPAAQAKLAEAESTYQPEALDELKRLSAIYNDPSTSKAGKKEVGKQLKQLANFMKPPNPKGQKGAAAVEALLPIVGGATGFTLDAMEGDDTAWDGAAIGAAAGAAVPHLPKMLDAAKANLDPNNVEQVTNAAKKIAAKLPQLQRFSLLANPQGAEQAMPAIFMNAYAGPYGAVLTTAIESILKNDPRGWQLLRQAWNPAKFVQGAWNSADEAREALIRGEEGRAGSLTALDPNSKFDKITSLPGQLMTTGDIYARKLLSIAGYTPEEARVSTLTSEPGKNWRGLANVAKNNPLMQLMFPFRRTPVNIMEQGAPRLPFGLGMMFGPKRDYSDALVETGLGTAAAVGNYGIASNIEDDRTRRNVRRLMSNIGGRYSLPSQIGYTMGEANAMNQKSLLNEQSVKQLFPLPATDVLVDAYKKGTDAWEGKANSWDDYIPTSFSMRPLRQWLGDRAPELRPALNVGPPPSRGLRRRGPRGER